jgi:oligogalacturonide lyase
MTTAKSLFTLQALRICAAFILTAAWSVAVHAADTSWTPDSGKEPPKSWIDPDTGHRVFRITNEPGSDSFYFNFNAFTPDGREMIYTTTDGNLMVLKLANFEARPLAKGITRAIVVGHKTPTIYFSKANEDSYHLSLWAANIDTGEIRKITDLPSVVSRK